MKLKFVGVTKNGADIEQYLRPTENATSESLLKFSEEVTLKFTEGNVNRLRFKGLFNGHWAVNLEDFVYIAFEIEE